MQYIVKIFEDQILTKLDTQMKNYDFTMKGFNNFVETQRY